MLIVLIRTLILYGLVVVVMRVMGKQQIGQLQPFELVVTLMVSELAAIPMENAGVPLINGIVPILTLLGAQVILSFISLKSARARSFICGTPSVLIENGQIKEPEMKRMRYNLSDLMEQLRVKNIPNISDVEFAILETNGNLSVIPKSQKRPVTPEDLHLSTGYEGLPHLLITDGHIIHRNLQKLHLDIKWLEQQVQAAGIPGPASVLLACLDTEGRLFLQAKDSTPGGKAS